MNDKIDDLGCFHINNARQVIPGSGVWPPFHLRPSINLGINIDEKMRLEKDGNMFDKNQCEDLGTLPNGAHLFRKPDVAGGYTYLSDEVGGGTIVWITGLISEATLLAAIVCEHHRKYMQYKIDKGWKPTPEMEIEQMAATGGSFVPPDLQAALKEIKAPRDGKT